MEQITDREPLYDGHGCSILSTNDWEHTKCAYMHTTSRNNQVGMTNYSFLVLFRCHVDATFLKSRSHFYVVCFVSFLRNL